jgi:hypothetical protein
LVVSAGAAGLRVDSFASFFFHESFFSRGSRVGTGFSSFMVGEGECLGEPLERIVGMKDG